MNAVSVVIVPKGIQLPFQIGCRPKQNLIEILAPDGPDQPFDEGMRDRYVWYRFNLLNTQYLQVGLPSVKRKQRIIIRAEISRDAPT